MREKLDQKSAAFELAQVNTNCGYHNRDTCKSVDGFISERYQDITDAGLSLELTMFYRPQLSRW